MNYTDWETDGSVESAIAAIGPRAVTPELLSSLAIKLWDWHSRGAIAAIRGMGPAAAPGVLAVFELFRDKDFFDDVDFDSDPDAVDAAHFARREAAARAAAGSCEADQQLENFSSAPSQEIESHLIGLLRDPDRYVRASAAYLVAAIGAAVATPEVIAILSNLLHTGDDFEREAEVEAVGAVGSLAATPEILDALAQLTQVGGLERAVVAIAGIGPLAGRPEIIVGLASMLETLGTSGALAVADALGSIGAKAATPETLTILERRRS